MAEKDEVPDTENGVGVFDTEQKAIGSGIEKLKHAQETANKKKDSNILKIISPKTKAKIIKTLIIIPVSLLIMVLFAGFNSILDDSDHESAVNAKQAVFGEGSAYGNNIVKIDESKRMWKIELTDEIKDMLRDVGYSDYEIDNMSQNDLIIELLKIYGLESNSLTEAQIQLLPYLIKAEIATQQIDLRKVSDMVDGEGNYIDPKNDTDSDYIQGTVHFKRINSQGTEKILEYIDYESFKALTGEEGEKYFSFNDEGLVVIHTWNHTKIDYTYDSSFPDDMKSQNIDNYSLEESAIDYKTLVNNYTLPFEATSALLIVTGDMDFTKQVADLAFNSNIEIGILEEYTRTDAESENKYYSTDRLYQHVGGFISQDGNVLLGTNDDLVVNHTDSTNREVNNTIQGVEHGNSYTSQEPRTFMYTAKENSLYETNTYKYGIIKADVWFMKLEKNFEVEEATSPTTDTGNVIRPFELQSVATVQGKDAYNQMQWVEGRATLEEQKNINQITDDMIDYSHFKITNYYYRSIETDSTSNSTQTKYAFKEGETKKHIYQETGEKFIKALEDNSKAAEMIDSSPLDLYDMLDRCDASFKTIVKYLYEMFRYGSSGEDIESYLEIYDETGFIEVSTYGGSSDSGVSGIGTGFWWPIGSKEVTVENGKQFAKGVPNTTYISQGYGKQNSGYSRGYHGAIDIAGGTYPVYIIASADRSCNRGEKRY